MSKWRFQSWLLLAWAGAAVVGTVALIVAIPDPYESGHRVGSLAWPWMIVFVVLCVAWRRTRVSAKSCPVCALELVSTAPFCPRCGYYPGMPTNLSSMPAAAVCPRCRLQVDQTAPSCPRCGYVPGQPIEPAPPQT